MTVGHPHPPEKVRAGVEAWKRGLIAAGIDPRERHCQYHARTHVNESNEQAAAIAPPAITRYDEISRVGRRPVKAFEANYAWDRTLATGRNNYGDADACIRNIQNGARHYDFDTLTTTFNFGGIPHDEIKKSMRRFAKEVMPALR